MKMADTQSDKLRDEYGREDFGEMQRGKYADRMKDASNVVVLAPDVAKVFRNEESVNQALRRLIEIAKSSVEVEEPSS